MRYSGAPNYWEKETAPEGFDRVPMESMDYMGYSYSARAVLARISAITGDGRQTEWEASAERVRSALQSRLWIEDKGALYDRDAKNEFIPILTHNPLRVMYFGAMTQDMADIFVKRHLLNPEEFFTPMPLPSVSANDPFFRNNPGNDWSGQPQGLTYQRAIRALENYGYHSVVPVLADKLWDAVASKFIFTQQFDPFTGDPSIVFDTPKPLPDGTLPPPVAKDGYGPTALACLEYASKLFGINVEGERVIFGAFARPGAESECRLLWGEDEYTLKNDGKMCSAALNGKEIFRVSCGVRIETGYGGEIKRIVNLLPGQNPLALSAGGRAISAELDPCGAILL